MKAVIVAFAFLLTGCPMNQSNEPQWGHHRVVDLQLPQFNAAVGNFADCAELTSWMQTKQQQYDYYSAWIGDGSGPILVPASMALAVLNSAAPANMISAGVAMPDSVATDNSRIFVALSKSIEILDSTDLHAVQTLTFDNLVFPQIFAANNQLLILTSTHDRVGGVITLQIYKQGSGSDYLLQSQQTFNGNILGARLNGGILTLVAQDLSMWDGSAFPSEGMFHGVACSSVRKPLIDGFDQGLTIISRIPVNGSGTTTSVAAWGQSNVVYLTSGGHLYLGGYGLIWFPWDTRLDGDWYQRLYVSRFDLTGTSINYVAAGVAAGLPEDAHAFQEGADQNTLTFATSFYNADYTQSYKFWVMSRTGTQLTLSGESPLESTTSRDFSLAWLGSDAIVTADTLKVWEFSQATQPAPANGTDLAVSRGALVPLSTSLLFSLAKISDHLQLALIDLSSPSAPEIVDRQVAGTAMSGSDILQDPRAIDVEADYFALPVLLPSFSGANIYALTAPLTLLGTVSHAEWVPPNCQTELTYGTWPSYDVERVFTMNGNLISISPFGAKASDPQNNFSVIHSHQFSNDNDECVGLASRPYTGTIYGNDPFWY